MPASPPAGPGPLHTAAALRREREKLGTLAMGSKAVAEEAATWRRRYISADKERKSLRSQLRAIEASRAYRLARALGRLRRHPVIAARTLVRRSITRLARLVRHPTASPGTGGSRSGEGPASVIPPDLPTRAAKAILSEHLPVHAYLALGYEVGELRRLAIRAQQAAQVTGNHVPLLITDTAMFPLLRDIGIAIEYLPDREVWERHRSADTSWDAFLAERLASIVRLYEPATMVVFGGLGQWSFAEFIAMHSR